MKKIIDLVKNQNFFKLVLFFKLIIESVQKYSIFNSANAVTNVNKNLNEHNLSKQINNYIVITCEFKKKKTKIKQYIHEYKYS